MKRRNYRGFIRIIQGLCFTYDLVLIEKKSDLLAVDVVNDPGQLNTQFWVVTLLTKV